MSYVAIPQIDDSVEQGRIIEKDMLVLSQRRPSLRCRILSACSTPSLGILSLILIYALFYASDVPIRQAFQSNLCVVSNTRFTNFLPNSTYISLSHDEDSAWDAMFPAGNGGFRYETVQTMEGYETQKFGIGMYHQLHCLFMLRERLQALTARLELISNVPDPSVFEQLKEKGPVDSIHVVHCIDYLRQSILCHADVSLERADVNNEVDGMVQHQCGDLERARAMAGYF